MQQAELQKLISLLDRGLLDEANRISSLRPSQGPREEIMTTACSTRTCARCDAEAAGSSPGSATSCPSCASGAWPRQPLGKFTSSVTLFHSSIDSSRPRSLSRYAL